MTTSASPALVEVDTRPDIGSVAVLTTAPSVTAHISDDRPGAELVDAVASRPAGRGLRPGHLARIGRACRVLPLLPDWNATLVDTGNLWRSTSRARCSPTATSATHRPPGNRPCSAANPSSCGPAAR
jgi:hypothetical protein